MSHHPEEDDAPTEIRPDGTVDHEHPYGPDAPRVFTDFGEVAPARLHGCPNCGNTDVAYDAGRCFRCGATFTPASDLPPRQV